MYSQSAVSLFTWFHFRLCSFIHKLGLVSYNARWPHKGWGCGREGAESVLNQTDSLLLHVFTNTSYTCCVSENVISTVFYYFKFLLSFVVEAVKTCRGFWVHPLQRPSHFLPGIASSPWHEANKHQQAKSMWQFSGFQRCSFICLRLAVQVFVL